MAYGLGMAEVPAEDAATLTLYKVTGPNGEPLHGGDGMWPMPADGEPGAWWDVPGEVQGCRSGLHLTDAAHLAMWCPRDRDIIVHRAEWRGPLYRVGDGDKYVCGSARLLPRTRPAADIPAMCARRDRALARAQARKDRADRVLRRTLGDGWAAYARRLGGVAWDHVPERVAVAVRRWAAEHNAADADTHAAITRCNAAVGRAMMPD